MKDVYCNILKHLQQTEIYIGIYVASKSSIVTVYIG